MLFGELVTVNDYGCGIWYIFSIKGKTVLLYFPL